MGIRALVLGVVIVKPENRQAKEGTKQDGKVPPARAESESESKEVSGDG